ncbi:GNAT family N-acetyltransferase [Enterococcus caccae]|uniref:N-acetyltransferase domain-containing protein n=1 Tax=Enterococcus caccae ATCC BAA-1240 TaxID=1158612 RepID=R3WDI9_9ENTE|nr:GNAT family N-acetyltransferase [Enterococcus caccae]EOL45936.1 hypothetical protein UC7_01733 [Enterococcus caccae ATCC BAA-1240]EOT61132.1 hypothetical protein I580_02034 [Enterococcus caccae ATCC BAA-1240]OJG27837.1 hypothetical protein RU98_GL002046 [Enterococcus caccae]
MIKKIDTLTSTELEELLLIWLSANYDAHSFIAKAYWQDNLALVKEQLPQAELYVYYEKNKIVGFLGMKDTYIAGIFVLSDYRNKGIGRQLLAEAKYSQDTLRLSVYAKNQKAYDFYQNNGFQLTNEHTDESTGELEYQLDWKK